MTTQAYPLSWPFGWPRCERARRSEFGEHSIAECVDEIKRQLHLLRATGIVISTNLQLRQDGLPRSNQSQPRDVGVAVYFKLPGTLREINSGLDRVLACDKWTRVEDNLWAIARHVDALRGQQRWGVGTTEQAFSGYQALPEPARADVWCDVLEVLDDATENEINAAFRRLAKTAHPDAGGTAEAFNRLTQAQAAGLAELRCRGKIV